MPATASFAVAPAHALHAVPKGFSFDQACNFLYGYETAYYAFMNRGKLQPGESRWVPVQFALAQSGVVSAEIASPQALPWTLDRTGRGCEGCEDRNEANNTLTAAAASIARGRPE